ncbi:MAG TPA: SIS domain-containing protein [Candidatus Acidoferrales bacterium]|nr:SIS domain-containing protein [Candidatus Acidoferrales bacterium]
MKETAQIFNAILESAALAESLKQQAETIAAAGRMIQDCLRSGGKLILAGNGGSAAQAQHVAAEMVGRFRGERRPLAALALTTDTSILTAVGNDYGFDRVFSRQLRGLATRNDLVLALSTSGNSPNILRALKTAREMRLKTLGLTGRTGGKMRRLVDLCLRVPSDSPPRIQEAHLLLLHILCELVERDLVIRKAGQ